MIDLTIFIPLFILGLVNSAHCIGMCGGIMGALTMAIPAAAKARRLSLVIAYNLGRITSYSLLGLLAGFFAQGFAALGGAIILRVLAALLLITMGLYLADWWRGLTKLENVGRYLWAYVQPFSKRFMPVDNIFKALCLGALWGWLPCGLVYAALASAMTQPNPLLASGTMLAFGLGTLPAVIAAGFAAQQLTRVLQQRGLRMLLGLLIILFGFWTLWGALAHQHHQHGSDHAAMNHENMDHENMNHNEMDHANMLHENSPTEQASESSLPDMHEHHRH